MLPLADNASDWLTELQSLLPDVDWAALQEAVPDLSQCGDFLAIVGAWLAFVVYAIGLFAFGLFMVFLMMTAFSLMIALASYLSCWYLNRTSSDAPRPRLLSYNARNIANSLLFIPILNSLAVAMVLSLVFSIFACGGSGHPPISPVFIPLALAILAVPPAFFLAFARFGMRFRLGRCFAGLLLFTLLSVLLLCAENMLMAALGVW